MLCFLDLRLLIGMQFLTEKGRICRVLQPHWNMFTMMISSTSILSWSTGNWSSWETMLLSSDVISSAKIFTCHCLLWWMSLAIRKYFRFFFFSAQHELRLVLIKISRSARRIFSRWFQRRRVRIVLTTCRRFFSFLLLTICARFWLRFLLFGFFSTTTNTTNDTISHLWY